MRETKNVTLLVVDDSEDIRTLIAMSVPEDYRMLMAGNGNEAIEIAQAALPDIIVCDHFLPGRPGLEVLAALRGNKATAGIPFILMTGGVIDAHGPMQPTALLRKPFEIPELLDLIARHIATRDTAALA